MTNHLLNEAGAALVLGIAESEIRRLIDRGEIPHVKLPSGAVRFMEADLWSWAESFRCGAAVSPLSRIGESELADFGRPAVEELTTR